MGKEMEDKKRLIGEIWDELNKAYPNLESEIGYGSMYSLCENLIKLINENQNSIIS